MRRGLLFTAMALGACSSAPKKQAALPPPPPPPARTLGDFAGTWDVKAMRDTGTALLAEFQMAGTADPKTWTITLPERKPMVVRATVAGDSLVVEAGPYYSFLRPGVVVVSTSVSRLQDGKLVGHFTAKYATRMVDSVLTGRTEGTRVPPP